SGGGVPGGDVCGRSDAAGHPRRAHGAAAPGGARGRGDAEGAADAARRQGRPPLLAHAGAQQELQ
ncbi:unnamed protein product, partial [Closterium sp. NIES-54]